MKNRSSRRSSARPPARSANVKISDSDIARLSREGVRAVAYYRDFGLAEVRSRALSMASSGLISLVGLLALGWSAMAMLVFLVVDAVITVVADLLRYPLARPWLAASHKLDHESGQLLLIADGLENGTGERTDNGLAPSPGVILFFGVVSTLFLVPILAAVTEKIGIASLRAVPQETGFLWIVGVDAVWRIGSGLVEALRVRRTTPGEGMIFMEAGGVAVMYASLLILVWLPLKLGSLGLFLLFAIVYLVRIAFGVFALIWTPRALAVLERRVATRDFALHVDAVPGSPR
ncbi:MAG TPA: hypothetical protein PKE12_10365 [Kiritimatiellia bacterium]|nr:hypothetical protein [Kiritimatiellia bacterium]